MQEPPLQVEVTVQRLPSSQDAPSLVAVAPSQNPVAGLQVPAVKQKSPGQLSGVPVQVPATHWSLSVHRLPSLQGVLLASGVWVTPATGSHASVVHGLASSTTSGVPAWHAPLLLQVSAPLQTFPSLHAVPLGT